MTSSINMKTKWIEAYMDVAERFAQLSSARKLKVGAVVVKDNRIISIGYNGTPAGWDNNCEDEFYTYDERDLENGDWTFNPEKKYWTTLHTKSEVIHAERNALDKLARTTGGGEGATLFVTHAPCMECSKSIYSTGIISVYYRHDYKSPDGIKFLQKCGISVEKLL